MRSSRSMVVAVMVVLVAATVLQVDGGREKRYFFLNTDAPFLLALLLSLPISLALPTLTPESGRSLQDMGLGTDGKWEDWEQAKSHQRQYPRPEDLAWDPAYTQPLTHLTQYFHHLELPTLPCQERLLCELSAEPDTFHPIGQVFTKELKTVHGPVDASEDSLIWRYMQAAREGLGMPIKECGVTYRSCPLPAERILNMSVLKVWQYIASKVNLQLV